MTTISTLTGLQFYVATKAMKAMRLAPTADKRREILAKVEEQNPPHGAELRAIVEAAFREEWAAKKEPA